MPDIKFQLHDVEDEDKMLCVGNHSENPAIAFALISTPPGNYTLHLQKFADGGDCHCAIEVIWKIVVRGMPITSITLRMVFVLAGIIGNINGVLIVPWISLHHISFHHTDSQMQRVCACWEHLGFSNTHHTV